MLAAVQASNFDEMERWDTCMVWVEGKPLSFVIGLNRLNTINIMTVIAKPYAEPKTDGTWTVRVAVD